MRFMTADEAHETLKAWAQEAGQPARETFGGALAWKVFYEGTNRHAYLSKMLAGFLQPESQVLLWVTEYGIWPSSENRDMLRKIRFACGESRPLNEAPAVLTDAIDLEDLRTLLHVSLLFSHGGCVVGRSGERRVEFSHDDWAILYGAAAGPVAETLRRVRFSVAAFGAAGIN